MLGLTIYCNCIETGKALATPKPDWKIDVSEDGMINVECHDPKDSPLMREWWEHACPHPDRHAFNSGFVNITGAAMMREEISQQGSYPVLLEKVFQDGVTDHYVQANDMEALSKEISKLSYNKLSDDPQRVIDKLKQATHVSVEIQKPICF